MLADGDIKAAFACKEPSLLLYTIIVAVQLVATHAQVGRAAAADRRHADAAAGAGLLRIIIIAVLLALQQQVTPHIGLDAFPTRLSADE
ncbi:Uncharacterised protein [Yersinia ruckeri]|nr:Uncharacterised protein [Yersinia ruckeri]